LKGKCLFHVFNHDILGSYGSVRKIRAASFSCRLCCMVD